MGTEKNVICMYTPAADGGHARYTWELMTALAAHGREAGDGSAGAGYRFELITSENLDPQLRDLLGQPVEGRGARRHDPSPRSLAEERRAA